MKKLSLRKTESLDHLGRDQLTSEVILPGQEPTPMGPQGPFPIPPPHLPGPRLPLCVHMETFAHLYPPLPPALCGLDSGPFLFCMHRAALAPAIHRESESTGLPGAGARREDCAGGMGQGEGSAFSTLFSAGGSGLCVFHSSQP